MRKEHPSILARIIWLHVLALAGISIAVSAATYLLLNSTANDFEEHMLHDHAAAVSQYLVFRDRHWSLQLPPDLEAIYSHGYGGYGLAVIDNAGRTVFSSFAQGPFQAGATQRQSAPQFFQQHRGSSTYYGMNLPVTSNGQLAWIQVAQNLENPDVIVDDVVALFLRRVAWIIIPIFCLLLLVDVLILRRVMAPIIDASRVALTIGPSMSHTRLPTRELPREVVPLANAVNEALERLEIGLQMQREFTADAAHELRTPLAVLRTHIDTTLHPDAAHALQTDIDVISRILEQLLDLAELDGFTISRNETVDLTAISSDVVSMMAPIALADGKAVELVAAETPVLVHGNSEMLFRAIRNLVENAIRFTSAGSSIEIDVRAPGTVSVKDRGPGVRPSDRDLIFRRFWRGNRQNKEHSGLGLAIVARTVQVHGGSVRVTDRPGGGAIFRMALPGSSEAISADAAII